MKNFISYCLIIIFGLLATGCSLRGSKNNSISKINAPIQIWRLNQGSDSLRSTITQFDSKNNTTINYQNNTADGYEINAFKSMASLKGPDIWSIPDDWLGDDASTLQPLPNNYYLDPNTNKPIDPVTELKSLYPSGIVNQLIQPDGKVYGVPTNVDTLQLYYNQKVFDAALNDFQQSLGRNISEQTLMPVQKLLSNVPITWLDLINQTQYLNKRNGDSFIRSAIALGTVNNTPDSNDTLALLMMQDGATIISTDRKNALFNDIDRTPVGSPVRPGVRALQFYTSFSDPSKANYSWNTSAGDPLDAFGQGKLAMVIAYSDFGNQLAIKYPQMQFKKAPVPQISSDPTIPNINLIKFMVEGVTQTANNPLLDFNFLQTYTDANGASNMAQEIGLSTPYLTDLQRESSQYKSEQILTGQAIYKKNHSEFDADFQQMIIDVNQNHIDPSIALDSAANKINLLLAQ